jgi:RHS repeat-associated protein
MKKLLILLLIALSRIAYADSQSALIYGVPTFYIDSDSYAFNLTWEAAPNTPDGTYDVDLVYDGRPPALFRHIHVTNGVCDTPSELISPDPNGSGHPGRVLYFGVGTHTWHWQGTYVNGEDATLAVGLVPYILGVTVPLFVEGHATITVGAIPTPSPTPSATPDPSASPTSDKPNDPHDGGNGEDGSDENGGDRRPDHQCTHGMARYTADLLTASLRITDTPLEYSPPFGPKIDFIIAYRQRDADQAAAQHYSHLGPHWTFNWMSYVTDDPVTVTNNAAIYVRGGGTEVYSGFNSGSQSYLPDPQSHAVLVRTSASTYEKRFPDGSKQVFGPDSDGATTSPRLVFMTHVVDAIGNSVEIRYIPQTTKIDKIIDPLNQQTRFYYEDTSDPYRITKVTDPFGRSVLLGYTGGKLTSSTDPVGIVSQFGYTTGTDFIELLTTPYGSTAFSTGELGTNRWLNMVNVTTGAAERVEYRDNAPGIPDADPKVTVPTGGFVNAELDERNSFFWDKKALNMYPPDSGGHYNYTKAKITHWLLSSDGLAPVPTAASEKMPLENRVWYRYADQPLYSRIGPTAQPEKIARVLADGTTQLSQFEYNALGNVTTTTDPVERKFTNVYDANGIDLLERRQTRGTNNELLASFTYNAQHLPLTSTDASGQTATTTYNSRGQVLASQNPKFETTTYAYGGTVPDGYLASITSPPFDNVSAVTAFTYDTAHRVLTSTDSDQYMLIFEYDNLDRPTKTTYPDGTTQESKYTDNVTNLMTLDVTGTRDRRERWSYKHYNSDKQLDKATDAAGRETLYNWCACGSLESIIDPNGNLTIFQRDLQGRVYQKVFADSKTIDYLFEGQTAPNTPGATSRLKSSTDALNRRTNYSYTIDNNVSLLSYTDTSGSPLDPPTPSISYTYDSDYNRILQMVDGIGQTIYAYLPITSPPTLGAGKLQSVEGPLGNDTITFNYDELGRIVYQSIAGNESVVEYDSLGRVAATDNALGHFDRTYDGLTPRLLTLSYPTGQTANYTYFGNDHDRRLQTLENLDAGSTNLSKFDYTYEAEGQILTWSRQLGAVSSGRWFEYDDSRQLLSARNDSSPSVATQVTNYGYDAAGNRITDEDYNPHGPLGNGMTHDYTPNNLNEIQSFNSANGWIIWEANLSHDLAGNTTDNGIGKTFEWDAANRLLAINSGGQRSEFTYDGLSRRVKIVEKTGSTVTSTKQFVWLGNAIAQERDGNNAVTRDYVLEGEQRRNPSSPSINKATNYYYSRDHLGSIREVTDRSGNVQARYDYDPYGRSTKLTGALDVDFGYTGHYFHFPSGLNLTLYRAYNPEFGRWLSRDPSGEGSGLNLYGYAANNSINVRDSLGLVGEGVDTSAAARALQPAFSSGGPGMINQAMLNQVSPQYLGWYRGIAQNQIISQTARVAEGGNVAPALNTIYLQGQRLTAVNRALGTAGTLSGLAPAGYYLYALGGAPWSVLFGSSGAGIAGMSWGGVGAAGAGGWLLGRGYMNLPLGGDGQTLDEAWTNIWQEYFWDPLYRCH